MQLKIWWRTPPSIHRYHCKSNFLGESMKKVNPDLYFSCGQCQLLLIIIIIKRTELYWCNFFTLKMYIYNFISVKKLLSLNFFQVNCWYFCAKPPSGILIYGFNRSKMVTNKALPKFNLPKWPSCPTSTITIGQVYCNENIILSTTGN
jgi:hypothetical protein